MRVAFTGGGTGGHIYPALAIDAALRTLQSAQNEPYEALFLGNAQGLESQIVPKAGLPIAYVPSRPLQRTITLETAKTLLDNAAGVSAAGSALSRFKPDAVIATGGYVCFPVIVAARLLRDTRVIPARLALLEINAQPGLTNRLAAPLVDAIWLTYPDDDRRFGTRGVVTGTPTRPALRLPGDPAAARAALGLDPHKRTIVVMGGSQGARSINAATAALVTRRTLPTDWQVLHVAGTRDYEAMRAEQRDLATGNTVVLVPYLDDPAPAYTAADIVVARAGASTLAELAVTGTPSILVPYPFAAEAHQDRNARVFENAGAAIVLEDAKLDGDSLWWALDALVRENRLPAMRDAARRLAPTVPAEATIARRVVSLIYG